MYSLLRRLASVVALTAIFSLCFVVIGGTAPTLHTHWLRSHVGSRVVKITTEAGTSGGTGSNMRAPSGTTYIVTNDHVCSHVMDENGDVYVSSADAPHPIKRHVLEHSANTDLCLIEASPGSVGLSIAASDAEVGDIVYQLGHPELAPLTLSSGQLLGRSIIEVSMGPIFSDEDRLACSLPKNKIEKEDTLFGPIEVCLEVVDSYQTSVPTFPGNSGSPVVNARGQVVAVMFAGSSRSGYGSAVPRSELLEFLASY